MSGTIGIRYSGAASSARPQSGSDVEGFLVMSDRAVGLAPAARLSHEQRRLLIGICIMIAAVSMAPSTYNFVLNPIVEGLGGSQTEEDLLRQLPSIAALLVIFLASTLGGRIGQRRLIFIGSFVLTFGCLVVTVAPTLPVATAGLIFISAASSTLAVVGLGLLSSRVVDPAARATAFASYALVAPIVYMALPVLAGYLLDHRSWRLVTTTWIIGALALIWGVWRYFPRDDESRDSGELATPILAGLTLAAGVQTITAINNSGLASTPALVRVAVTIASAIALAWCYHRSARPSISTAALKHGGMLVLLVVVIVVPFVNLWFYLTLGYQYVFGMTAAQTAVLMVPPQLAGVVGALIARRFIQQRGITLTGVVMLIGLAVTLLLTLLIAVESPIWLVVAIMALYALTSVGASVPITNAIMNTAPLGEEGSASAFRGASIHIGTALGVVIMSTIVYSAAAASLTQSLGSEGLASSQSAQIAESIRSGTSADQASSIYAVPVEDVEQIESAQQYAMVDGLHAHGLAGAVFIGAAAAIFWFARRRHSSLD